MSARDRMDSADIPPGAEVKIDYFNLSVPGSIEYNIDQESLRRSEHAFANFVVTNPTLFDDDFGIGYTAADSLLVSRNTGDNATVDVQSGIAYVGGRRYKQLGEITGTTVAGSPNTDDTYYIHLRYTKSTGTFDFYAALTIQDDTDTIKYLSLCSAVWDTTPGEWTAAAFVDLRASNTKLIPPITFTGSEASNYILTIQNTNAALLGLYVDGYVKIGDTSLVRKIDLYGSNTVGLTIYDGSSTNVTLVSDNTDRLKILSNLYVPTATQLGSMSFSATTISGAITFDCGASPTFSTSSGDFGWNSENFTAVGAIGCSSVDASGNVQGSELISDVLAGTAPLTVTSGTVVPTLNVDQVDGFDMDQAVLQASTPIFAQVTITSGPVLSATGIAGASGDTITNFSTIGATTSMSVTNGPTISATGVAGASGDNISGFTNIAISGSVTSGTWNGTAITNAYLSSFGTSAQLDQDCRTTATPEFDYLKTTSTPIATAGYTTFGGSGGGFYAKFGTTDKDITFYYYSPSLTMRMDTTASGGYDVLCDFKVTGTTILTGTGHVYPESDDTYDCGITGKRWNQVYTHYIVTGDIILDNGMVINETVDDDGNVLKEPKDGHIPGIQFNSTTGQTVMIIDNNGSIHLPSGAAIVYDL